LGVGIDDPIRKNTGFLGFGKKLISSYPSGGLYQLLQMIRQWRMVHPNWRANALDVRLVWNQHRDLPEK
jgi:hypothetical protein